MTTLDMSLDDRIKSTRTSRNGHNSRGARGRGRGSGGSFGGGRMSGPIRRGPLMVNARPSPYTIAKSIRRAKSFPWQHDLLEDSIRAAGIPGIEIGTKLYVSNLDNGVTNEDIRELFSEIGELKRYAVHYDKNGRPSGSAEVVYMRRSEAFAALKRYNNVLLDGKPMKIEILGDSSEMPVSARVNVTGVNGKKRRTVVMPGFGQTGGMTVHNRGFGARGRGGSMNIRGRGRGLGRGQGGSSRGGAQVGQGGGRGQGAQRGRGRGRGKKPVNKTSVDELDKDLDNYHAEAMHIS